MTQTRCACCGDLFAARRNDQRYCFRKECRRKRKGDLQKKKLATDLTYRMNHADAQRRWRESHKGYWHRYRESHPWYAERNRRLQRHRNKRRRKWKKPYMRDRGAGIAKMDAQPIDISGTYRLIPLSGPLIANMDDRIVRLMVVAGS
jgi:hypothetical protein